MVRARATCAALWETPTEGHKHREGGTHTREGSGTRLTQKRIEKATLGAFQSIHLFSSIHMPISNSALFKKRPPILKDTY